MSRLLFYIYSYFRNRNYIVMLVATSFVALLVFLNYTNNWETQIDNSLFLTRWIFWFGLTALAFLVPHVLSAFLLNRPLLGQPLFWLMLMLAPLLFSFRMALPSFDYLSPVSGHNLFWNHVLYWPILAILMLVMLVLTWLLFGRPRPFFGLRTSQETWKIYGWMLVFMLPMIAWASTQADFLAYYPKLNSVERFLSKESSTWLHRVVYEMAYGTDFFSVELFFRGFLVLAFIRWAGEDAILPMACFYCTIHFGKPMAECISSFFGGLLLGAVSYHTRSIYGGLTVHLGIAWMMEIGGYIGRVYFLN